MLSLCSSLFSVAEKASVIVGKLLHYTLLLVVPSLLHSPQAALIGAAGYSVSLSIMLAMMFFVSHNVPESKPLPEGPDTKGVLYKTLEDRDWGVQQVRRCYGCGKRGRVWRRG